MQPTPLQLCQALREGIWQGEFPPGSQLHPGALAEALGVDVAAVREALRLLEAEGFAESDPAGRIRIPSVSPERFKAIMAEFDGLLSTILPAALRQASAASLAEFRKHAEAMDHGVASLEAHLGFWQSLLKESGEPRLQRRMEDLLWQVGRVLVSGTAEVLLAARDVHPNRLDFVAACESRDPDQALRAWRGFVSARMGAALDRLG